MSDPKEPSPGADVPKETILLSANMIVASENPGDRIGRYKLLQEIGEGGMGTVWMAEQEEPVRRRVALKVIKLGMDTKQVIGRFEAERQALALMDHPNIAKVLDAGSTENGRPFFAMELVKGIPITRYCDDQKLGTEERLKLFTDVCHAIQHAHQKGIIHRDIKPSNILVTLNDGVPMPKVIDFGIAKATGGQTLTDKTVFTAFEQFVGTPAYMSPEQAEMNALDIDTRSDIYALGVLLYELLTGKTPFDAKELVSRGLDEIRRIIREVEPPRPSTRLSTLDAAEQTQLAAQRQSEPPKLRGIIRGDLDWIVMKTLEKDRTRRYDTANGLAMDIQRYLNSEPVVARPPSTAYRIQKAIRRNKLAYITVSLIAGILLLGTVIYIQTVRSEERKTKMALAEAQANFRLARKAIQESIGMAETQSGESVKVDRFAGFIEMYRHALITHPDDAYLLLEQAQLLMANSQGRWINGTNQLPSDAETNLDEATILLERITHDVKLDAEQNYLLALVCQHRISLWQQHLASTALKDEPMKPPRLAALGERAKAVAEKLACENPREEKYVKLWLNLTFNDDSTDGRKERNLDQILKELPVIDKLLESHPDSEWAIRMSTYGHWRLGATSPNVLETLSEMRTVLDLYARLLRAPSFRPNVYSSDYASVPTINPLAVCSALLRSSEDVENDVRVLTNLMSAAQYAIRSQSGSFLGNVAFWESDWHPGFALNHEEIVGMRVGITVKIAYHLLAHARSEAAYVFATNQISYLEIFEKQQELFGSSDSSLKRVATYLRYMAATAAIRTGHFDDAARQLVPIAGRDVLKGLQGGVNWGTYQATNSIPKIPVELELRHLGVALLDEVRASANQGKLAEADLDFSIALFEKEYQTRYCSERDALHYAFAQCRRATIKASMSSDSPLNQKKEFAATVSRLPVNTSFDLARMLALARENSRNETFRRCFGEAAMIALRQAATLGAYGYRADQVKSFPEFRTLAEMPDFSDLLASFGRAAVEADKLLSSDVPINVSDTIRLQLAAVRGAEVKITGRIGSVKNSENHCELRFLTSAGSFVASRYYNNSRVPSLIGSEKNLNHPVGGILVFKAQPQLYGYAHNFRDPFPTNEFAVGLQSDGQILSFEPDSSVSNAQSNISIGVGNITANDLGKQVSAEGKIKSVNLTMRSSDGDQSEIRFEGTEKSHFVAVLGLNQNVKLERDFSMRSNKMVGATIRIKGLVEVVAGRPQIFIPDASQIDVVQSYVYPTNVLSDTNAYRAEDISSLLAQLGKEVTVEGRVSKVSLTAAGNAANIELAGPESQALLIWSPAGSYEKLTGTYGDDLSAALENRIVRITGRLGNYGGRRTAWKDRLQITLDDPTKLLLVAPTAK